MAHIELKTTVGPDGVLTLAVPVGIAEANREVRVTVESLEAAPATSVAEQGDWRRFIERTAGSIPDPTFKRHEQGEYERQEDLFS